MTRGRTEGGLPDVDPVTLAVVWNSLIGVADEMGAMLKRTAFSPGLREAQDFATTLYTANGRLVAHGECSPGHLGSGVFGVPKVIARLDPSDLAPGDGIVYNDLSLSVGHLPDVFCLTPIFVKGELLAFAVSSAHMIDVGGLAPGSLVIDGARDVYAEGLRVTPVKLFRGGEPIAPLIELIAANVRLPEQVVGDLGAVMNANRLGAQRVAELATRYDPRVIVESFAALTRRSEQTTRAAIASVPNGTYTFDDQLDDYGPGTAPLRVAARVTVEDEDISVDFEGSSPQVSAGINSYFGFTAAYTVFALKSVIDPHSPMNDGVVRPLHVSAPEGSFLNARHPAPGGGRAVVLTRVIDVVNGALSKALPERVPAAPSSYVNACIGRGHDEDGAAFVYFELIFGGSGASAEHDGVEAICSGLDVKNIPVEVSESTCPIVVERLALVPDSGGAGRTRGGCGIRKDIRVLADGVTFTNLSDRVDTAPYGLAGGRPGTSGMTVLIRDGEELVLPSKGVVELRRADVLSLRLGGAGGFGPPEERLHESLRHDIREGYVTELGAERDYGLALTTNEGSAIS